MAPRSGDNAAYGNGWLMDWSGVLFSSTSNNGGSGNRYWYPSAEGSSNRFAWNGGKASLSAFAATPAESSTSYLTSSELSSRLGSAGIPGNPVTR